MKILYAAGNSFHSRITVERFLRNISPEHSLKISAYKKSAPSSGADWTLDPLLFPKKNGQYRFADNRYLQIYIEQVKSFDPDLIISDFELYTSFAATKLSKKLWHVSNRLFNFGIDNLFKKHINIHTYYKDLYEHHSVYALINDFIEYADKNYVYSHFCDMDERLPLKSNFDWVRPYYQIGKKSEIAKHNYVAVDVGNYNLISYLHKKVGDKVLFSNYQNIYDGFISKNLSDHDEYYCNVANCDYYVSDGSAALLSDAFYNERKMILVQNYSSLENLFNYMIYHQLYRYLVEDDVILPASICMNDDVKFLHERIQEIS